MLLSLSGGIFSGGESNRLANGMPLLGDPGQYEANMKPSKTVVLQKSKKSKKIQAITALRGKKALCKHVRRANK